jgi:predicted nucleic acid-binding protein
MRPELSESVLYLDSNVFIYAVENSHQWAEMTEDLLGAIEAGRIRAVASELVLAEVLAKPFADGNMKHVARYKQLLSPRQQLSIADVSRDVLIHAAQLRGDKNLKLFDAIHVATAQMAHCDYFLTQDERLGRTLNDRPKWLKLSEIT